MSAYAFDVMHEIEIRPGQRHLFIAVLPSSSDTHPSPSVPGPREPSVDRLYGKSSNWQVRPEAASPSHETDQSQLRTKPLITNVCHLVKVENYELHRLIDTLK